MDEKKPVQVDYRHDTHCNFSEHIGLRDISGVSVRVCHWALGNHSSQPENTPSWPLSRGADVPGGFLNLGDMLLHS